MMKNLPTFLILAMIIGLGIWWYQTSSTSVVQLTPGSGSGPTLELVNRVKRISIDTSIFSDQQFLALTDSPPLDVAGLGKGRANPFVVNKKAVAAPAPARR